MLGSLRRFFDQHIAERPNEARASAEERARVAAAALLVEVVRGDDRFSDEERAAVLDSVQRKFGLAPDESRLLLSLAEAESREAHDYFQFTSRINASYSQEHKLALIEELWRVAYADAALHRHEEHLIRRVADLLHLSHGDFIRAKLRVQESVTPLLRSPGS
ncbi:MAG: TerB family tellurite resistance protein [Steroidobacteraceae bacterium]